MNDRMFNTMLVLFWCVFVILFLLSMGMFIGCWVSSNPNSMACYMISDRTSIDLRERK
jgi:hypothetical protein